MAVIDKLNERLAKLQGERQTLLQQIAAFEQNLLQLKANAAAYDGAIQECNHWIAEATNAAPDDQAPEATAQAA